MSWIKVRKDVFRDPAVIQMSAQLGIPELHVVGALAAVWAWADDVTGVSRLGHVSGVTTSYLDRLANVPNFADAMVSAGWLKVTDNGITFPNFDRHMSKSAKERCQGQYRKSLSRSRHGSVPPASRRERDKSVTRVDEMREEQKDTPSARVEEDGFPSAAVLEFVTAWNALGDPFPHCDGKDSRLSALAACWRDAFFREHWVEALRRMAASAFCRGGGARKWVAHIGWFLNPDKVRALMEGQHDDRASSGSRSSEMNDAHKFDGFVGA